MAVSGCCGGDGGGSEWVHWRWLVVTAPLLVVVVAVLLAVVVVACGVAAVSGCGRWCVCAAVLRVLFGSSCFSARNLFTGIGIDHQYQQHSTGVH